MTSNSFPGSIQCLRAVRDERRANDLTVEALVRELILSALTTVTSTFSAAVGWYVAYDKRQQRRRHHYRRAVNAVSVQRLSAQAAKSTAVVRADHAPLANARFVHIAGGEANSLPNAVMGRSLHDAPEMPAAYICARVGEIDAGHAQNSAIPSDR